MGSFVIKDKDVFHKITCLEVKILFVERSRQRYV